MVSLIPSAKSTITDAASAQCITVMGVPGIGKSTFGSKFPNALFVATEPGLNFLEVYQTPTGSWPMFKQLCLELGNDPQHVETLIIDTVDLLYIYCKQHHNSEANVRHASENGKFGMGFDLINTDFRATLSKLTLLRTRKGNPMGLVFVTHAKEKETKTDEGTVLDKWRPSLSNAPEIIVIGMCDIVLFLTVHSTERIILTDKNDRYTAKDRTGRLPAQLPLDYQAFADALGGQNDRD